MSLAPRPVRHSQVTLVRVMSMLDANSLGNVHGGVIMREVDNAAGTAATRHAGRPCVTAAIDELSFLEPVHVGDLLYVTAQVNAVGSTSLEIGVRVEAEPSGGGTRRHTTSAYLVFVALAEDGRPAPVPPLICETEEERHRHAQALIRRQVRKERIERLGAWMPDQQPAG
ncbi:MAG: acyl-CoA thioesterase [Actinobacteria bacterium]|nr:acyl-CoA thioesterase [Actinomycetota bacterium]